MRLQIGSFLTQVGNFAHQPFLHLHQRIHLILEKCKRVSAHYQIDLQVDKTRSQVTALTWVYQPQPASKQTHPGVYQLRTTQITWDDETLWRTYTLLTDLEPVFGSLKS